MGPAAVGLPPRITSLRRLKCQHGMEQFNSATVMMRPCFRSPVWTGPIP